MYLSSYDYYNVTDTQLRKDHVYSTEYPRCIKKQANYFEQNGLIFTSKRRLKEYISTQVKNSFHIIYVRLAEKLKVREIVDEMTDYGFRLLEDMGMNQMTAYQTVNEAANTLRITFR